jgi:hypothetical protein
MCVQYAIWLLKGCVYRWQTEWSEVYASGPEVLADLQRIVEKYKLMQYIRLRHELTYAAWDEDAGKWRLRIRHTGVASGGEDVEIEDTADILLLGVGWLSRPKWPKIPGLREFRGRLLHTAQWDVGDLDGAEVPQDWHDKAVGVIGNVRLFSCADSLLTLNDWHGRVGLVWHSNRAGPSAQGRLAGKLCSLKNMDIVLLCCAEGV